MDGFLALWSEAAYTSAGLFWMAFWAFGLGYLISSLIQVFVTRARMREQMGGASAKSVGLGTFFGFVSSSCSFAALSTTRALFARGAGAVPALAFMLASTNLVVELGIVIALFLSWQFVVGEYLGGILLIVFVGLLVGMFVPDEVISTARERANIDEDGADEVDPGPFIQRIRKLESWREVGDRYVMEWKMVWKDVAIGFTVAGIISAFVPASFFEALFVGSSGGNPTGLEVVSHAVIGPVAAFFTFIGSMGNIPLAAVLFGSGVSFAGVMAFIFSDLVVFPVLRIQAEYYGWKIAVGIAGIFLVAIVATSTLMHFGFDLLGLLPSPDSLGDVADRQFFKWDYSAYLNIAFGALSVFLLGWHVTRNGLPMSDDPDWTDRVLDVGVGLSGLWLIGGGLVDLLGMASYLA
jgi:uncharacterized membrane protein YraQ (UPF0718 family)